MDTESNNLVEVTLKKSSTKDGGIGYDISVKSDGKISQKQLDDIAEMSVKTALKVQALLS